MTDTSHSQINGSRRIPEVLHEHGIWRRSTGLGKSIIKSRRRRFSFTQHEIDCSAAVKVYQEDSIIDKESPQSREFEVLPSPPVSVWSFAMSSDDLGQLSDEFALCDPKNLRYHRDGSTVSPSVRHSINSTNADYGFSVATSDSDSSSSKEEEEEEVCSDLLSFLSDIPREIVIHKSLSQRFPLLRRLSRKIFRPSKLEL